MGALIVLVILSLVIALGFLGAFLWAVRSGQFDDPVTPSLRLLAEDATNLEHQNKTEKQTDE